MEEGLGRDRFPDLFFGWSLLLTPYPDRNGIGNEKPSSRMRDSSSSTMMDGLKHCHRSQHHDGTANPFPGKE